MSAIARSSLARMVMAMPSTNPNYTPPDPNRFIRMLERETSPDSTTSTDTIVSRSPQLKPKPPMDMEGTRSFLRILQGEADQNGHQNPLTIAEFLRELVKLPKTLYDPSNHCFETVTAAAKADPWNWYKRPAFEFLESEFRQSISQVKRQSSLSAAAREFVPAGPYAVQIEHHHESSPAVVLYHQMADVTQYQSYIAAQHLTPIIPPSKESTQIIRYRQFERSHKRQNMDRIDSPKAITQGDTDSTELRTKYKGEETKFQQRNLDCTEEDNVAIRLNNLPPDVTMAEVLHTIFEGKVFSSSLVSPKPPMYPAAAANITFLTLEAADAFFVRGVKNGIWIRGYRLHVIRNRNRVRYFDRADELTQSRVLHIFGPAGVFSAAQVMYFLHWFIDFEEVVPPKVSLVGPGMAMLVVVFQSIYGQSRQAKKGFEELWMTGEFNPYGKHYQVAYGPDPCDPAARLSAGGWDGGLPIEN